MAKPRTARRPVTNAGGVAMLPVAAVSGLADCSLVTNLARGRVWIVLLGLLLGGIVAMNVWGLSLSSSSSATAAKIDALQQDNGVLRKRIASRLSAGEVETAAARLGLGLPASDAIKYLDARDSDAARAADRLGGGELSGTVAPVVAAVDPAAVEPVATTEPIVEPVEPAVTETVPVEPAVVPVTEPTATEATVAVDPTAGGVAVP